MINLDLFTFIKYDELKKDFVPLFSDDIKPVIIKLGLLDRSVLDLVPASKLSELIEFTIKKINLKESFILDSLYNECVNFIKDFNLEINYDSYNERLQYDILFHNYIYSTIIPLISSYKKFKSSDSRDDRLIFIDTATELGVNFFIILNKLYGNIDDAILYLENKYKFIQNNKLLHEIFIFSKEMFISIINFEDISIVGKENLLNKHKNDKINNFKFFTDK